MMILNPMPGPSRVPRWKKGLQREGGFKHPSARQRRWHYGTTCGLCPGDQSPGPRGDTGHERAEVRQSINSHRRPRQNWQRRRRVRGLRRWQRRRAGSLEEERSLRHPPMKTVRQS